MIISLSGKIGSGKNTVGKIIQYLIYDFNMHNQPENEKLRRHYYWPIINFLQDLENNNVHLDDQCWQIKKWADSLRQVAAIMLGMPLEFTYRDDFKQILLPDCWDYEIFNTADDPTRPKRRIGWETKKMTGRDFLQKLGTDAVRNGLHTNAWVNALMSRYVPIDDTKRAWNGTAIDYSNCEFPNWIITDTRFPNELEAVKNKLGSITVRINRIDKNDTRKFNEVENWNHPSETALDDATFDYVITNDGSLEQLVKKVCSVLVSAKVLPS